MHVGARLLSLLLVVLGSAQLKSPMLESAQSQGRTLVDCRIPPRLGICMMKKSVAEHVLLLGLRLPNHFCPPMVLTFTMVQNLTRIVSFVEMFHGFF